MSIIIAILAVVGAITLIPIIIMVFGTVLFPLICVLVLFAVPFMIGAGVGRFSITINRKKKEDEETR